MWLYHVKKKDVACELYDPQLNYRCNLFQSSAEFQRKESGTACWRLVRPHSGIYCESRILCLPCGLLLGFRIWLFWIWYQAQGLILHSYHGVQSRGHWWDSAVYPMHSMKIFPTSSARQKCSLTGVFSNLRACNVVTFMLQMEPVTADRYSCQTVIAISIAITCNFSMIGTHFIQDFKGFRIGCQ